MINIFFTICAIIGFIYLLLKCEKYFSKKLTKKNKIKQIEYDIKQLHDALKEKLLLEGVNEDKVNNRCSAWLALQLSLLKKYGPDGFRTCSRTEIKDEAAIIEWLYKLKCNKNDIMFGR